MSGIEWSKYGVSNESKSDTEKGVLKSLSTIRDEQYNKSKQLGDFSSQLETDYERIKADTNNDGKVDENEYKKFVVEKTEKSPAIISSVGKVDDVKSNHNYYHFDITFVAAIGIICLSLIICTFLKYRK